MDLVLSAPNWRGKPPEDGLLFAHDLVRKPAPIPDQVEDKLYGIMRLKPPATWSLR
jgi:hypothetical protein